MKCVDCGKELSKEQEEHNEKIAAPEMLEALTWAIGQLEYLDFNPEFPGVKKEWNKAREILVKAEVK